MNNALMIDVVTPVEEDKIPWLRAREGELVSIIEALAQIESSSAWSTLKTHVFDGVLETLERRQSSEVNKSEVDTKELYRLQGQIAWAKKYSKLDTLAQAYRLELTNVRNQLKPPGGAGQGS